MPYKIRDVSTGLYSQGIVRQVGWGNDKRYDVDFTRKGKEWAEKRTVKTHLLKCMTNGVKIDTWEVVEVTYTPLEPILSWFDQKMLIKVMKNT